MDVLDETGGNLRRFLTRVLLGTRDEGTEVDEDAAQKAAQALFDASQNEPPSIFKFLLGVDPQARPHAQAPRPRPLTSAHSHRPHPHPTLAPAPSPPPSNPPSLHPRPAPSPCALSPSPSPYPIALAAQLPTLVRLS